MKGISPIIATLLMLLITLGLAGLAYTYISGVFTARTRVILSLDPDYSSCNSTGHITVVVRNEGTEPIPATEVKLSGTNSTGNPFPEVKKAGGPVRCSTTGTVPAGGIFTCSQILTGSKGYNTVIIEGGGSKSRGTIYCPGP